MEGQESYSSRQKLSCESSSSTEIVLEASLCQLQEQIKTWDGKISSHLTQIHTQLKSLLQNTSPANFEPLVALIIKLIKQGSTTQFLCKQIILKRLCSYYNSLCNLLQKYSTSPRYYQKQQNSEVNMLKVLSLLSQIINENQSTNSLFKFPFTKRFSQNIFMMSFQLVKVSAKRKQILRILSVFIYSLAKQIKLKKQFQLSGRIKATILENYFMIEDKRTFQRFNKALRVVVMEKPLSYAEMKKYKIVETVERMLGRKEVKQMEVELPLAKMEMANDYSNMVIVPQPIRPFSN